MLETGIYVRVSTEEQAQEGYSIRAQEEKLRDFARIKEWLVYKIYMDEGISGKNITERPAINEMIADIKDGKVKNVLVFKIDRLTRNTADLISLIDLFNEHNCAFNSLTESIDTHSATGRMFIKIIGIFAEFERENIAERVRTGLERKAKEGYALNVNNPSYGYDKKEGEKIQTINEPEAVIVREIFDMFLYRNISYCKIAKELNNRNIPTKNGSIWKGAAIKSLLTNCNYKGYVRYAMNDKKRNFETKGHHQPIISEELYDETQKFIKKISVKVYKKHPKEDNCFSGIVFCGVCGRKMISHGDYKKDEAGYTLPASYRCTNRLYKKCTASDARHTKVEEAFIEYINTLEEFDTLDEVQLTMKQEIKTKNLEIIGNLKKQYEKLERKAREALDKYIHGHIDFDNYMLIKTGIDKEQGQVSGMMSAVEILVDEEVTIEKENIIRSLKENWEYLSKAEKRQFIISFIEKIEIVNEKEPGKREGTVKVLNVEFNKG